MSYAIDQIGTMSYNQLYKIFKVDESKMPFKKWIATMRDKYNKQGGEDNADNFLKWVRKQTVGRMKYVLRRDGEDAYEAAGKTTFLDKVLNDVSKTEKVAGEITDIAGEFKTSSNTTTNNNIPAPNPTKPPATAAHGFLGLPKGVTILMGVVIGGALIFGIVKLVSKKKVSA